MLRFPRDDGAHLEARTEWWYATGWLATTAGSTTPRLGFQLTFFRSRTDLAADSRSRFAARQLLFAHAAVTDVGDLARPQHRHAERIARWHGQGPAAAGWASTERGEVHLQRWSFVDEGAAWRARLPAGDFSLDLRLERRQARLLQGDAGFSRKGPDEAQASYYVSEPQLQVQGEVRWGAQRWVAANGRAWLDHEWSDELLHPEAVGWDWVGLNGLDGAALTAFRLRRADGTALWAGGSWRDAAGRLRVFGPQEVRFTPGRRWTSPGSQGHYPVEWTIETPLGRHTVRALADAQEMDSRGSTGSVYWEGLSEWRDAAGDRLGWGYLEMTGYAGKLQLG